MTVMKALLIEYPVKSVGITIISLFALPTERKLLLTCTNKVERMNKFQLSIS